MILSGSLAPDRAQNRAVPGRWYLQVDGFSENYEKSPKIGLIFFPVSVKVSYKRSVRDDSAGVNKE